MIRQSLEIVETGLSPPLTFLGKSQDICSTLKS